MFTHDTETALLGAAALVNTGPQPGGERPPAGEELTDPVALAAFLDEWDWSGRRVGDDAELRAVRRLRTVLARLWRGDEDEVVGIVNDLLREARALPQLVRHGRWDYHIHATSPDAPLADRMAVEAAMAMTDLVRAKELDRLRVCAADDCSAVLVDLSKNRSRRYCDAGCGNRMNVAAYRARRAR